MKTVLELSPDEVGLLYEALLKSKKPAEALLTRLHEAYREYLIRKHLDADSGENNQD